MKKFMEENLAKSKATLAPPHGGDVLLSKSRLLKLEMPGKEKLKESLFDKYMSPAVGKKGNGNATDASAPYKKLREIISRKNLEKRPSQQISQVK